MMLRTSTRNFGDVLVLDCSGRIVFGEETAFLHQQVKDLLNQSRRIVLNLAAVSYIDSIGVGTLVGIYTSATGSGGNVKLAGLTGRVKDVLQITKLATVFEQYPTVEEAVASFGPSVTAPR